MTRRPSAFTQPVYFANMALLDHRACRGVEDYGGPGWKQPCLRPRLEIPAICISGGWLETPVYFHPAGRYTFAIPARGAAG